MQTRMERERSERAARAALRLTWFAFGLSAGMLASYVLMAVAR